MSASNRFYKESQRLPLSRPLSWKRYFREVVAKDSVLWIALGLAAISAVVSQQPLSAYASYIDYKTLAALFSLMVASGGFMLSGLFDWVAVKLVRSSHNTRLLLVKMVACVFFSSMLITNDVALIVFVPMTLIAYRKAGVDPLLPVVLETVAANIGNALFPVGNPQNLFLFSRFHMGLTPFLQTVAPICLFGGVLLFALCFFAGTRPITAPKKILPVIDGKQISLYAVLFLLALLGIFNVLDYRMVFGLAVLVMIAKGKNLALQVDYALLVTFIGFFIFVGNIQGMPIVESFLVSITEPDTYLAGVLASQVISNVPAAILLSNFTAEPYSLLAGVSVGGCGTLIASMASLISYKLYIRSCSSKGRYLAVFTIINVAFILVLSALWYCTR